MVPEAGLEPARRGYLRGILSPVCLPFHHSGWMEAATGVEPVMEVLQTSALPLGDAANSEPRSIAKNETTQVQQNQPENGAGDGSRTHDFNLGKVAL